MIGEDGAARCWWGASTLDYVRYHDTEWGFGVSDDHRLFEKLSLEGFQSGLSWLTILRKREEFRAAFADFDPTAVSEFDEDDVERLLGNAGIVRHESKIRAVIGNATAVLGVKDEFGSLARYVWRHADLTDRPPAELPPVTPTSTVLSKDLKRRGFKFVGPTTVYAFMQAMGLVNDHLAGCHVRDDAQHSRIGVAAEVNHD